MKLERSHETLLNYLIKKDMNVPFIEKQQGILFNNQNISN